MKAYFDTSALTTLVLEDAGWPKVLAWLSEHRPEATFSDFGWGEFVAAIGNRVRSGLIGPEEAAERLRSTRAYVGQWSWAEVEPGDVPRATALVARFELGLRLPDALHIVMAQRLDCMLVTTDRRQFKAADALGCPGVDLLSQGTRP